MKDFELDVNQLINDAKPTLEVFDEPSAEIVQNIFVSAAEYKQLLDVQCRFNIARSYIATCEKFSIDKAVLNLLFNIDGGEQ